MDAAQATVPARPLLGMSHPPLKRPPREGTRQGEQLGPSQACASGSSLGRKGKRDLGRERGGTGERVAYPYWQVPQWWVRGDQQRAGGGATPSKRLESRRGLHFAGLERDKSGEGVSF